MGRWGAIGRRSRCLCACVHGARETGNGANRRTAEARKKRFSNTRARASGGGWPEGTAGRRAGEGVEPPMYLFALNTRC